MVATTVTKRLAALVVARQVVRILTEEQRGLGIGVETTLGAYTPRRADDNQEDRDPAERENHRDDDGEAHRRHHPIRGDTTIVPVQNATPTGFVRRGALVVASGVARPERSCAFDAADKHRGRHTHVTAPVVR
jgi:hypothetical protein